jgi:hypothetical protein
MTEHAGSRTEFEMARTPRPRRFEWRLEANTTREQSDAVDMAFAGQLVDRATKIRLLVDFGLKAVGINTMPARPAQNGKDHTGAVQS